MTVEVRPICILVRPETNTLAAWNKAQGAQGGCDGSLILAGELARGENNGLRPIADYIQGLATKYKVGVADMIGMLPFLSSIPVTFQIC